jgi:predicted O-methyltransferase YrrM
MNIVVEYIKYRWNAKKRHGIHSPFIYDLSDKCASIEFPNILKKQRSKIIEPIRQSNANINVTDLGAGSLKMSPTRPVRKILQYSSSNGKWGEVLYKLCRHYQPQNILELGTSLGIGTWHMSQGSPTACITSLEGCPETYATMKIHLAPHFNEDVNFILSSFDSFLDKDQKHPFDFIFIDGHHDGEALTSYIKKLLPFSHDKTLFVLDDIRWSKSMIDAWNRLQSDESFHVSIDLFRMGILIKRSSQEKEHFTLKI